MQRHFPRNLSRRSIPVTNAVVVDKADTARSSQPYPEGGPCGERGSVSADRVVEARSGRLTNVVSSSHATDGYDGLSWLAMNSHSNISFSVRGTTLWLKYYFSEPLVIKSQFSLVIFTNLCWENSLFRLYFGQIWPTLGLGLYQPQRWCNHQ
jgi:hypothetical protein